jgi:catechol 2,3-dioxygenase-like lactoylglutathione lyase family enzyme
MINIKGIDHINMSVKNFEESIRFYKKFFNMEVLEQDISQMSGNKFVVVGIPGVISLCLYENNNINFNNQMIGHFGINVSNFEDVVKTLEKEGIKLLYGGVSDWENSRSVYIADPSGHEIELTKNFGGGF